MKKELFACIGCGIALFFYCIFFLTFDIICDRIILNILEVILI